MIANLLNISKIEDFFYKSLCPDVSKNVFAGNLPPTIKDSWKDIVVIDCATSITDMNAYGRGVVLIWLYAKPLPSGAKDVKAMAELEDKCTDAILAASDEHYVVSREGTYQDYDSEHRLYCNIVEVNLLIK